MTSLILLFLCLILGIILTRNKLFPEHGHLALNAFVINISLSALSLYYIPKITLNLQVVFPVAVAWLNILLAIAFFGFLGKKFRWSKSVIGALIMCAGFGNTSFVGIPVIQALFGDSGLKTVMLVDQPGSFVALSTVGIAVANLYSGTRTSVADLLKKIIRFPPFIAFTVAVLLNLMNVEVSQSLNEVFKILGATTVPLALVSVGSQLRWQKPDHDSKPLFWGLFFKLIIFPAGIFVLYFMILEQRSELVRISFMESAMAPMITAAIIASAHRLEPRLCNLMIGVGIPLSFLTLFFWYVVMQLYLQT
ncbi:MAG: AEC family transporter [Weeksellaceae bacterium]|nr:AEC family transporter [Weeksellaceae bacterium]